MKKERKFLIVLTAIILGAIALDQLTKWLAVVYLQGEPSFPLWKGVLHFTFVKNEGAAFGIFSDQRWIFMLFSSVAIIILLVYLFRFYQKNMLVSISLAMIIGGGIGNMVDRIALGYVIDFIDFTLINFAVFNVADSFVTVGAFVLMGYLIWDLVREWKQGKEKKNDSEETSVQESASSSDLPEKTENENGTGME